MNELKKLRVQNINDSKQKDCVIGKKNKNKRKKIKRARQTNSIKKVPNPQIETLRSKNIPSEKRSESDGKI